jgi:acyl dehydratase
VVADVGRPLDRLEGWRIGPVSLTVSADRVSELVAVTGDDADRWTAAAPPSFAAVTLFTVAKSLLAAPELAGRGVIHAEQTFDWHRPYNIGSEMEVEGVVGRVRSRGPATFVGLEVTAGDGSRPMQTSTSSFVVVETAPADPGALGTEPGPEERGANELPVEQPLPAAGSPLPPLAKSASRGDLLRYAAATGDWNPIHWDHATALSAGLPGIVAHGLLMAAWVIQAAARHAHGDMPLRRARVRFRSPLRPAEPGVVGGEVVEGGSLRLRVDSGGEERVTATLVLGESSRTGG